MHDTNITRMNQPVLFVTQRFPDAVEARAERDYAVARGDLPADAVAIMCSPADRFDAARIAALPPSVRAIGTFSVGYDHIDLDAAHACGIVVCNTPDVLSRATAECAMMLMLMASRRAGEGERLVRAGAWSGWTPTHFLGRELAGGRLGIFGMGRIGRIVAELARGFGMVVHYRNRTPLLPADEHGAIYHADDASFLAQADVLSLNAPGGDATRNWLDAGRLALLPHGAIVVNTARGSLIDDTALIAALRSGAVAAAGLDVYVHEPDVDPRYRQCENAVLLPHLGSATVEARNAMGMLALDGIDAVLAGRRPAALVERYIARKTK